VFINVLRQRHSLYNNNNNTFVVKEEFLIQPDFPSILAQVTGDELFRESGVLFESSVILTGFPFH
jgi:hypothetical protein